MEANPSVILCYGRTCLVDQETGKLSDYADDIALMEESPHERFSKLRRTLKLNNAMLGLIRTDCLLRTNLNRLYQGGDIVLMAELALLGRIQLLPDILLYRRMGQDTFSSNLSSADLAVFIDPLKTKKSGSPTLSRHVGFLGTALRAPINPLEKLKTLAQCFRHAAWDKENLLAELREALRK
jgi:hypothetical protein